MSTENIGVAKKAKPNLRKTKIILEKIEKLKFWGVLLILAMADMAGKKLLFLLVGMVCWYCLFMVYLFFYLLAKRGKKKKVYIDYNKESIKQFFKL